MHTTIQNTGYTYHQTAQQKSWWKQFLTWAGSQEDNRFLWTAIAIVGHGCLFTILTLMAILFTGNHFIFWPFAIAAMTMTVVTNLAALPAKITIPIFFISLLIDVAIIIICLSNGVDTNSFFPQS